MNIDNDVQQIESAIFRYQSKRLEPTKARRIVRNSLRSLAKLESDTATSLLETFRTIANSGHLGANRKLGAISIRLITCDGLLPKDSLEKGRRHIVQIIESTYSNLISQHVKSKRAQSHEKIRAAILVHEDACQSLQCLSQPFSSLEELVSRRQLIMRELNQGPTRQYLGPFHFGELRTTVTDLLKMADDLIDSQGHRLQTTLQNFLESVTDDVVQFSNIAAFPVREYLLPFLERTRSAAIEFESTMADRFDCSITVPNSHLEIEKKYPLHVVNSTISLVVTLTNEGPGVAQEVTVSTLTSNCQVENEPIKFGDVLPGSFP